MPYSTVARTLRSAIWAQIDPGIPRGQIDDAIAQALGKLSLALVKELARRLCCAPTTIYRHLAERLHFVSEHLRWLPPDLTAAQKAIRIEKSNKLPRLVKSAGHNEPTLLVTLDERWFYFLQDFERQRLPHDERLADRSGSMVSSSKVVLAVVRNTEGFHVVDLLPKGASCDTRYYCEDIISEILRACPVDSNRRLVIYVDDARPHTSKRTREFMERNNRRGAPHPPFSPNLAHSHFFLFGYIEAKLKATELTEKDGLLAEIREMLNGMSGRVLKAGAGSISNGVGTAATLQFIFERTTSTSSKGQIQCPGYDKS
jgi:hypothetical protein